MQAILELLSRLSFLATTTASLGVLVTAGILVIVKDWRISLLSLAAQYVLVGVLYTRALPDLPQLAGLKALIGLMICPVLFITAQRVRWGRPPKRLPVQGPVLPWHRRQYKLLSTGLLFRVVAVAMVALVAYNLATRPGFALPEVSPPINVACYFLLALGLLGLGLTEEPLKAGLSLLTFLSGFELFYAALVQALAVIGLLGLLNLLIVLAVSYMTVARAAIPEPEEDSL